ncbi:hypothetical protein J3F84DRAFT_316759 [Trichoderma pleuroticola]
MINGHDICTVSTLRRGIWADAEGVVGPMSWINTVVRLQTMADTPGRTHSVSCEYARLSPEVTLQFKSGFFAINFLIRQMDSPSYRAHAHFNTLLGRSLSDTTSRKHNQRGYATRARNTQKKHDGKITHNEPHADETRGSHWAVPNRRRTRAATGWQLLEPSPCNICHQSRTWRCVNLVGSGSHPPQHHGHGSINAG